LGIGDRELRDIACRTLMFQSRILSTENRVTSHAPRQDHPRLRRV
jgi:hypothetical protein